MSKTSMLYRTDSCMMKVYQHMLDDFEPWLANHHYLELKARCRLGIRHVRGFEWPGNKQALSPYAFKCQYQLENFFKRYIFADDVNTPADLRCKSFEKFISQQATFGIKGMHPLVQKVLDGAREECARILGPFSKSEWFSRAKFGSKAALGLPARMAYLDERVERLTGSQQQLTVFIEYLQNDHLLKSLIKDETLSKIRASENVRLSLTAVPKSYKAMRLIAPDTSVGGFLSQGLGRYIRQRLEDETHIRLATAQENHKRLAQKASLSGHLVTADLSAASDSFTMEHATLLLPKEWLEALLVCRVPDVTVPLDSGPVELSLTSLMLMGSGHTFPLQTLLFYCLLKAVADISGISHKCYVYGDDLIYHRRMHRAVCWTFRELGFTLNLEKTFAGGSFRESCGGDFFRGLVVRPHMPEGVQRDLDTQEYVAFLYQLLNGLLDRWSEHDIPTVKAFLLTEIVKAAGCVLVVREDDPPYSGLRHLSVELDRVPVSWPSYFKGGYRYGRLVTKKSHRQIVNEGIYAWDKIRSNAQSDLGLVSSPTLHEVPPETIHLVKGLPSVDSRGMGVRYGFKITVSRDSVWPGLPFYRERWTKSLMSKPERVAPLADSGGGSGQSIQN